MTLILGSFPTFTANTPETRYIGGSECQDMLDAGVVPWYQRQIEPWLDAGFRDVHFHLIAGTSPGGDADPNNPHPVMMELPARANCLAHPDPRIQRLPQGVEDMMALIRARTIRVNVSFYTGWYWWAKENNTTPALLMELTAAECEWYRSIGADRVYLDGGGAAEVAENADNIYHDVMEAASHIIDVGIEPGPTAYLKTGPAGAAGVFSPFLLQRPWLSTRDTYRSKQFADVWDGWGPGRMTTGADPPPDKQREFVQRNLRKFYAHHDVIVARHILAGAFGAPTGPDAIVTDAMNWEPDPAPDGNMPWEIA